MKKDIPVATVLPEFKLSIVGMYRQQHGGSQKPQEQDMEALSDDDDDDVSIYFPTFHKACLSHMYKIVYHNLTENNCHLK